ncbi:MAG: hypothetical protein WCP07_09930 [bacterium]
MSHLGNPGNEDRTKGLEATGFQTTILYCQLRRRFSAYLYPIMMSSVSSFLTASFYCERFPLCIDVTFWRRYNIMATGEVGEGKNRRTNLSV